MKIRHDARFVSSILFTLALLALVPSQWSNALADPMAIQTDDTYVREVARFMHDFGVAALATISVSLIVVWTGYIKGLRSAWFIMFIVVWAWAFPAFMFPYVAHYRSLNLSGSFWMAVKEPGPGRQLAEVIVIFFLMVVALFLPLRSFFWGRSGHEVQT